MVAGWVVGRELDRLRGKAVQGMALEAAGHLDRRGFQFGNRQLMKLDIVSMPQWRKLMAVPSSGRLGIPDPATRLKARSILLAEAAHGGAAAALRDRETLLAKLHERPDAADEELNRMRANLARVNAADVERGPAPRPDPAQVGMAQGNKVQFQRVQPVDPRAMSPDTALKIKQSDGFLRENGVVLNQPDGIAGNQWDTLMQITDHEVAEPEDRTNLQHTLYLVARDRGYDVASAVRQALIDAVDNGDASSFELLAALIAAHEANGMVPELPAPDDEVAAQVWVRQLSGTVTFR
jgi:hypothetical protein